MSTAVIGEVTETRLQAAAEWRIADFYSLPEEVDVHYDSPDIFQSSDASWLLRIFPHGQSKYNSTRCVGIYLIRDHSSSQVEQAYTLGLKKANGNKDREMHFTYVFNEKNRSYGAPAFLSRTDLMKRKSELTSSDVLTITCSLRIGDPKHLGRIERLSQDLSRLMLSGDDSNVTIRVKGEEFRLHRNILGARVPVFNSMFKHEMSEKTTGIVSIEDCEADTFRVFLHYVYTGRVDKLSPENVFGLYEVADKYQVDELKADCLECMKNTLSEDTFYDAIALVLTHDDGELMKLTIDLLSDKMVEIMQTVKWQTFLKENSSQANELLIKAAANLKNNPEKFMKKKA